MMKLKKEIKSKIIMSGQQMGFFYLCLLLQTKVFFPAGNKSLLKHDAWTTGHPSAMAPARNKKTTYD